MTVYGKWDFTPKTYTLTYEVVGDKPSDGKTDKTPDKVTDIPYNTVQDIENGLTTRDGQKDGVPGKWTFKGWYDNPECKGDPVDPVTITSDMTVYGKWEFVPDETETETETSTEPKKPAPPQSNPPVPKTGDTTDLLLWILLLIGAALSAAGALISKKRYGKMK